MTADIKRGLTGARGRGRGLQRSVSNVSHLSPRARPICGVRAVTGVYRDNLYPQQHVRQQQSPARLATTAPPASVNRSFSSVSDLPRTYQRCDHVIITAHITICPPLQEPPSPPHASRPAPGCSWPVCVAPGSPGSAHQAGLSVQHQHQLRQPRIQRLRVPEQRRGRAKTTCPGPGVGAVLQLTGDNNH